MNLQSSPNVSNKPRFRVHTGLRLELNNGTACITATLSPDQALSLAMVLLYEAREQIACMSADQGGTI